MSYLPPAFRRLTTREMAESIVESGGLVPEQPAHWTLDVAEDYLALRRVVKFGMARKPPIPDHDLDWLISEAKRLEDSYRTGAYE